MAFPSVPVAFAKLRFHDSRLEGISTRRHDPITRRQPALDDNPLAQLLAQHDTARLESVVVFNKNQSTNQPINSKHKTQNPKTLLVCQIHNFNTSPFQQLHAIHYAVFFAVNHSFDTCLNNQFRTFDTGRSGDIKRSAIAAIV